MTGPWDEPDAVSSGVNERYFLTIIDNYIGIIWANALALKWKAADLMLLGGLGLSEMAEVPARHSDSSSAIALTQNPENHQRTKHIRIHYHFLRDLVMLRVLNIQTVSGPDNPANIFIRPLSRKELERHSASMEVNSRAH